MPSLGWQRPEDAMDEHDDDLESEVHEGAALEIDAFPDTGDELDEPIDEPVQDVDDELNLDEDEAEL
jgi:hypothetical protein